MADYFWNFNASIAYPLELIARKILNIDDLAIKDTIYYAPNVCGGTFVEAMYELLCAMRDVIDSNAFRTFEHNSELYWGKVYSQIPMETAIQLFEEFKEMMPNDSTNGQSNCFRMEGKQ